MKPWHRWVPGWRRIWPSEALVVDGRHFIEGLKRGMESNEPLDADQMGHLVAYTGEVTRRVFGDDEE